LEQIEQWVRTEGERMLFIYGATDPWSAGAFDTQAKTIRTDCS
jgi:hypothetical protein